VRQRRQGKSTVLYSILRRRKRKSPIGNKIFYTQKISAITRVEFLSDRLSHTVLRGVFILMRMHRLGRKLKT
jgi:hypothetical protein